MAKAQPYKGKLGTGTRFANCLKSGATPAQCASRGVRAHGQKAMTRMAVRGRRSAGK